MIDGRLASVQPFVSVAVAAAKAEAEAEALPVCKRKRARLLRGLKREERVRKQVQSRAEIERERVVGVSFWCAFPSALSFNGVDINMREYIYIYVCINVYKQMETKMKMKTK